MRQKIVIALVLLAGCAAKAERPLRPLELATAPYLEVSTAAVTGSLMYEGGCLLFRDGDSKALLLPVWPAGSTFNGTSVTFHQPARADQRVVLNEQFHMEGRPMDWSGLSSSYYDRFQRQCGAAPFVVTAVKAAN